MIEETYSTVNIDTLEFGSTIVPLDLHLQRTGNDLRVEQGTDSITLKNQANTGYGIDRIDFANDTTIDRTDINRLMSALSSFNNQSASLPQLIKYLNQQGQATADLLAVVDG